MSRPFPHPKNARCRHPATLRGGNEIIFSAAGNIAAGAASKTVQSAPPTRVLIDPQSGDVKTDLAGLATGGGIGVLATVGNVAPGNPRARSTRETPAFVFPGTSTSPPWRCSMPTTFPSPAAAWAHRLPPQSPHRASLAWIMSPARTPPRPRRPINPTGKPRSQTAPEDVPSIITVEILTSDEVNSTGSAEEEEARRKKRKQEQEAAER